MVKVQQDVYLSSQHLNAVVIRLSSIAELRMQVWKVWCEMAHLRLSLPVGEVYE